MGKKIIAVIPAFNEEKYIGEVVKETRQYVDEVIVVDDGSSDKTSQLAGEFGAIVLKHKINLKKGTALKTGCEGAKLLNADIIILLDGDGQHDPKEIPLFLKKLKHTEIVFGVRNFNKEMPLNSRYGNIILTTLSKILLKNKISDLLTGYKAFNTRIYNKILWDSSDYSVETEIIKNIKKYKIPCSEIRIKTIYNDPYKGSSISDGVNIAINMAKWRLK